MPALSKRTKQARNLIIKPSYSLEEGVKLLKQTATTKQTTATTTATNSNNNQQQTNKQQRQQTQKNLFI